MPSETDEFKNRYGRWGMITGGSDGLGAAFAAEIAQRGLNLVLVARGQDKLDALAEELRAAYRIEVKTVSLDLTRPDASELLRRETVDIDLGLVVFNAGADASGQFFHDMNIHDCRDLLQRNILFLTESLYEFGGRFRDAGRGGLVVVGSAAAFGGGARGALYTASKGFALNLCESLWAELQPYGVDLQTLLFRIADTPTLRGVLKRKGIPVEATSAVATDDLARSTLDALADGPVFNFDESSPDNPLTSGAMRRAHTLDVSAQLEAFYGPES